MAYLDCTDRPTADVAVQLIDLDDTSISVTETTGPDGGTTFDLSQFTSGQIAVFVERDVYQNPPAVFCSTNAGGATELPVEVIQRDPGPNAARFVIEPQAGDRIGCDFYIVPPAGEPTPPPPTAPAGEAAAVTIYKTACPPGYDGDDYFADCFDDPQAGVEFFLARGGGGVEGTTGPAGFVTLVLPGDALPGLATAQEVVPAGFAVDFFVFCTMDDGATVVDVEQETGAPGPDGATTFFASFEVAAGDQIRCDWYNIPPAQEMPTPGPSTPTPAPEGYPAQIRAGTCAGDDNELGDVTAELIDVVEPEGDVVGQDGAIVAAASLTVLPLSLDELLAEDHVVVIFPLDEADEEPILCGEIGGIINANGSLILGLEEENDSGYAGIAFFEPDPDDASQTLVSLIMAEGLAQSR